MRDRIFLILIGVLALHLSYSAFARDRVGENYGATASVRQTIASKVTAAMILKRGRVLTETDIIIPQ